MLLITCDSHGPLAQLADYVMTASNREQRLIEGSHAASLLSPNVLIEVLYYLLRMEKSSKKTNAGTFVPAFVFIIRAPDHWAG